MKPRALKTHCKRGHDYANARARSDGRARDCLECHNECRRRKALSTQVYTVDGAAFPGWATDHLGAVSDARVAAAMTAAGIPIDEETVRRERVKRGIRSWRSRVTINRKEQDMREQLAWMNR